MKQLIEFFKSKGRTGAIALILLGIGHMAAVFMGKVEGSYEFGAATMFTGVSLLGIRKNQDLVKESVPVDQVRLGDKTNT